MSDAAPSEEEVLDTPRRKEQWLREEREQHERRQQQRRRIQQAYDAQRARLPVMPRSFPAADEDRGASSSVVDDLRKSREDDRVSNSKGREEDRLVSNTRATADASRRIEAARRRSTDRLKTKTVTVELGDIMLLDSGVAPPDRSGGDNPTPKPVGPALSAEA